MAKITLDVVGKGYRSIGFPHRCPDCGSDNTYFSCSESAWVCYDCGEVFETPATIEPTGMNQFRVLACKSTTIPKSTMGLFDDLRAKLKHPIVSLKPRV